MTQICLNPPVTEAHPPPAEQELRELIAAYFCRMADTIGQPRSVALLYHTLFLAAEPLGFSEIMQTSGLSKASTSTGLRLLQRMRAIERVVLPGDRRAYYRAELSTRRLITGFVQETLQPGLDAGQRLLDTAATLPQDQIPPLLAARLTRLRNWHELTLDLHPALNTPDPSPVD